MATKSTSKTARDAASAKACATGETTTSTPKPKPAPAQDIRVPIESKKQS